MLWYKVCFISKNYLDMKQTYILLSTFFLLSQFSWSQSKLKQAKENLNEEYLHYNSNTSETANTKNNVRPLWVDLLIEPIIWLGVHTVVGEAQNRTITPYPYYQGYQGEYSTETSNLDFKNSLLDLSSYYTTSKDAITGLNLNATYRFIPLLGIEFNHIHLAEKYFGEREYIDISSLHLNYYRIREKHVTAYWSLGASYIANEVNKLGFSYALGTEIFPFNPISIGFKWQQSFINAQSINQLKLELSYHLKQVRFFTGFHNYDLAGIKNPSFAVGINYRL